MFNATAPTLPLFFAQNIIQQHGQAGQIWLNEIPQHIEELKKLWGLSDVIHFENLTYNYVAHAMQGTTPVVIKMAINPKDAAKELETLKAFQGHSAVNILAHTDTAMLLQAANGGSAFTINNYNRKTSNQKIVAIANELHKAKIPAGHPFTHLKDVLAPFDNPPIGIDQKYIDKAKRFRDELLATAPPDVLLHGDLHYDNILSHNSEYLIIDPKGYIGDPAYEFAAYIANPYFELLIQPNYLETIQDIITMISMYSGINEKRLYKWFFVYCVIVQVWLIEDGGDVLMQEGTSYLDLFKKLTIQIDLLI